jgi:hypothetical protein
MRPKKPEATGGRRSVSGQTGSDHQYEARAGASLASRSTETGLMVRIQARPPCEKVSFVAGTGSHVSFC